MVFELGVYFIRGVSTLIGVKNHVDFQESCIPMILKMNSMSFNTWNLVWCGEKGLYINEFACQYLEFWNLSFNHL